MPLSHQLHNHTPRTDTMFTDTRLLYDLCLREVPPKQKFFDWDLAWGQWRRKLFKCALEQPAAVGNFTKPKISVKTNL